MRKENKLYKLDGIPPAARFYLAFSTEAWLKNLKLEEKKNLVSCQNLFWLFLDTTKYTVAANIKS